MEKKPLSARAAPGPASAASLLGLVDHRPERPVVGHVLRHALGHDQMIVGNGNFGRVAEHELVSALAQKAGVPIGPRQLLQSALLEPLIRRGISASALFSSPMATSSPPGSWSSRSAAFCQLRTWRRSCARVSRSACSESTRSRLALAAMRVESIATRPSFTRPLLPRPLQHLREGIVQRPSVTAAERAQRPVVYALACRQVAECRSSTRRRSTCRALVMPSA